MTGPVTPARAALHDLIATMQAIATLQSSPRPFSEAVHAQFDKLEARQAALEKQLQDMVQEQLGVDYATLWHAVTPTGTPPKLP